jgi:hypothetical protein
MDDDYEEEEFLVPEDVITACASSAYDRPLSH